MYQETEDVCVLFYGLAGGFASPMARLRVHPHHQGLSLALEEKNSQLAQAHKVYRINGRTGLPAHRQGCVAAWHNTSGCGLAPP